MSRSVSSSRSPRAAASSRAAPASAQAWPDKPVRILVPAPAGSSLDVLARAIGDKLKDKFGQPVVVENKPAAGGTVATGEVARSRAGRQHDPARLQRAAGDGPLIQKVPYDVQKDLAPVIITSSQPNVLAVNAELPIKSLAELVAWAKANPGKLNFASVGNGEPSHLNAELLKAMAGIDAVHVPFNGSPPAVLSTVQGETQMIFAVMQPLQAQIQAGKLRAIAVTTPKRFPLLPELPAIAEAGYPGFEALAWNGLVVPAGTPRPSAQDQRRGQRDPQDPDVVQKMNGFGFDLVGGTPDDFARAASSRTRGEAQRWTPMVRTKLRHQE